MPKELDLPKGRAWFYYDHAGYCWDPKTETEEEGRKRTAERLAEAETYAKAHGWNWTWGPDATADPFDWDGEGPMGEEAFGCILYDAQGHVLESLWGIWDPTWEYREVVQADLALEAMRKDLEVRATVVGYAATGIVKRSKEQ